VKKRRIEALGSGDIDTCKMELGLDYAAWIDEKAQRKRGVFFFFFPGFFPSV
jgi:hypothetical protein